MEAAWLLFEQQNLLQLPLHPCDTERVLKKASAHVPKQPAGDHVCRGGKRKAEKKESEGGKRKGANPAWMVVAARSQALAQLTWAIIEEGEGGE